MCGLVGTFRASGSFYTQQIEKFMGMGLYTSALRGMGGTGVGLVDFDYEPYVEKSYIDASNWIFSDKYGRAERKFSASRVIMGHTRAPTTGKTSTENAHPFWFYTGNDQKRHIMFTHNGHINNHTMLTPNSFSHQVDSAHVAYALAAAGGEALDILNKITGYYVFVWFDQHRKTMNIAKDGTRDLYLANSKDKKTIYYASEKEILQFCLDRTGIDYEGKGTDEAFYCLEEKKWLSWDLTSQTLENPKIVAYEGKKWNPPAHTVIGHTTKAKGTESDSTDTKKYVPQAVDRTAYIRVETDAQFHYYSSSQNKADDSKRYGFIWGKRNIDQKVAKINSICKKDWDEKWSKLHWWVPVIVTRVFQEWKGKDYVEVVDCHIDLDKAEEDLELLKNGKLPGIDTSAPKTEEPTTKKAESSSEGKNGETVEVSVKLLPNLKREIEETVPGPNNTLISKKEWLQLAKMGCRCCNGSIIEVDIGHVEWFAWQRNPEDLAEDTEYQMICPTCARDEVIMQTALGV